MRERDTDMEPTQNSTQGDVGAELVTETLVEEVSIDGMCGVY
jgi:mycofactocin precursor